MDGLNPPDALNPHLGVLAHGIEDSIAELRKADRGTGLAAGTAT